MDSHNIDISMFDNNVNIKNSQPQIVNKISYEDQIENLTKSLLNYNYIFEVTKCCGYSTFVLVSKKGTLLDMYKSISLHFECPDIKSLFVMNENTKEKMKIPVTDTIKIFEYIPTQNRSFFMPVYPIPQPVVFRIYLDDGHHHMHHTASGENNNEVFNAGL